MGPKLKLSDEEVKFIKEYLKNPNHKGKKTKLPIAFNQKFGRKHSYNGLVNFLPKTNNNTTLVQKLQSKSRKTRREINKNNYDKNKAAISIKNKYIYNLKKKKLIKESVFDKNLRLFKSVDLVKYDNHYSKPSVFKILKRINSKNNKTLIRSTIRKAVAVNEVL